MPVATEFAIVEEYASNDREVTKGALIKATGARRKDCGIRDVIMDMLRIV